MLSKIKDCNDLCRGVGVNRKQSGDARLSCNLRLLNGFMTFSAVSLLCFIKRESIITNDK